MRMSIDDVLNYPDAISQVQATSTSVYWLASIAAEDGRTTIRRLRDGVVTDITPNASVRSRAMEYGGGAYSVEADRIAYCDDRTKTMRLIDNDVEKILTPSQSRYVYGGLKLAGDLLYAVREDHHAHPEPRTDIVALDLDGDNVDGGTVVASGADFYAGIAVHGNDISWYQWMHPHMSWDSSSVWRASIDDPSSAQAVYDQEEVSAQFPLWLADGRLGYVCDKNGYWNWQLDDGTTWSVECDCAPPTWVLNPPVAALVDGRLIATVAYSQGRGVLALWDPETGQVSYPLPGTADIESIATDGSTIYVVAHWADREPSLVSLSPDGAPVTIAGPDRPYPHAVCPQPLWSPGRQGKIHSWLYLPAGISQPPLIVMTHGGPTSMASCGYRAEQQFWISRGFAVLDVNYSGSTGFGREYRNRLRGRWGLLDVADVADAVADVTRQGLADPQRVAITGGSAGGFTTLASLTNTTIYAAGISRYGIGDLTTLATDTHKAESRYLDSLVAPWPEGKAIYEQRSPINHLDTLTTPMLILQGSQDKVVPPSQAEQMAAAVRNAHKPVALVILEGEGHGFRGLANRRLALEAQVSFLEQIFALPHSSDVPVLRIEGL